MLFTRCPECETTFRLTDETLKKANGQVRCGRCASVFNAYAELHDPGAKTFEPEAAPQRVVIPAAERSNEPAGSKAAEPDPTAQSIGASSLADVVAEAKQAAAEEDSSDFTTAPTAAITATATPAHADLSATEVDRVLASNESTPLPQTGYAWPSAARAGGADDAVVDNRWWRAAAACASLLLVAQVVHHFRADIAGNSTFGAWLASAYGAFGAELTPHWDVHQYRILDWVATAEPNSRGLGSLKITARIQNRGPSSQPYPAVQLRLKDRWEAAVGSRMFTPAEYLSSDPPRGRLMSPGETARAEIEVVDPGPDAYGFELDVCIEVEASLVTCGTDAVFL